MLYSRGTVVLIGFGPRPLCGHREVSGAYCSRLLIAATAGPGNISRPGRGANGNFLQRAQIIQIGFRLRRSQLNSRRAYFLPLFN